jgi:hypothetical protein
MQKNKLIDKNNIADNTKGITFLSSTFGGGPSW